MRLQVFLSFIVILALSTILLAGEGATPTPATWLQTTPEDLKVTTDETGLEDTFGSAIAGDAGIALVGASHSTALGAKDDAPGQAFLFTRDTSGEWAFAEELVPSAGSSGDRYGDAVAIDGNVAVVGAPHDGDEADDAGAVYVFRYDEDEDEWIEEAKLTASNAAEDDEFGFSVAVELDRLLVGARDGDGEDDDTGTVYYFEYDADEGVWTELQILSDPDGADRDDFGVVAMENDVAVIGAPGNDTIAVNAGRVFIYRYDDDSGEWEAEDDVVGTSAAASSRFGSSVATNGVRFAAGSAAGNQTDKRFPGVAVFVYDDEDEDWDQEETLYASDEVGSAEYGASLAMFDDYVIVGAPENDAAAADAGAVYVYQPDDDGDWIEIMKLIPDEVAAADHVGHAVTFAGISVLAGAPNDDDTAADAGAFYSWDILPDCNGNSIADSQDVEDGISEDCNDNGLPDECDLDNLLLAGEVSAEDADATDELGTAVAVSHGVALVAALRDDDAGTNAGAVYAFGRSDGTWSQQDKLTASDGSSLDSFGYSVAMDGALAVIGARRHDLDDDTSDSGSVYVFARDAGDGTWNEVAQLLASDALGSDNFGYAVDIADSTVVVGARNRDEDGSNSGSVYIYNFDGSLWSDEQRVEAEDAEGGDRFGESVALDEDGGRMVIGAPFSDDDGSASGSAYVFTTGGMSGVSQQAKLTAADATGGDQFGIVVAITGDTVLVGAPEDDTDAGVNGGSVYVFTFDGDEWSEDQQLTPSDGASGDNFGSSIALDGSRVIIGAMASGDDRGAAYVFELDGDEWVEVGKLTAPDGSDSDEFGTAVGIHGHLAVAAAPGWDSAMLDAGRAYVFAVADCNGNELLDVCELADGDADDCNGDGVPDECQDTEPTITWGPADFEACTGDEVTLQVAAVTGPDPTLQWQLDDEDIAGATSATLTIKGFGTSDAGPPEGSGRPWSRAPCRGGNVAVRIEACDGSVSGALAEAAAKRTPRAARPSSAGVSTSPP